MDYIAYLPLLLAALLGLGVVWTIFAGCAAIVGAVISRASKSSSRKEFHVRTGKRITYIVLTLLAIWQVYFALYPDDDFYLAEFEVATYRTPPNGSKVMTKHATYPDFHGDYCSFSRIKLPISTYQSLLAELRADKRFTMNSQENVSAAMPNGLKLPAAKVLSTFTRNDTEVDHHYSVSFLEPGDLIEVHICVT